MWRRIWKQNYIQNLKLLSVGFLANPGLKIALENCKFKNMPIINFLKSVTAISDAGKWISNETSTLHLPIKSHVFYNVVQKYETRKIFIYAFISHKFNRTRPKSS